MAENANLGALGQKMEGSSKADTSDGPIDPLQSPDNDPWDQTRPKDVLPRLAAQAGLNPDEET